MGLEAGLDDIQRVGEETGDGAYGWTEGLPAIEAQKKYAANLCRRCVGRTYIFKFSLIMTTREA